MGTASPTPTRILRMDRTDVETLLRQIEDDFEEATGTRLSSVDFYRRYCRGEFDHPFGMTWAIYYEAFVRLSGERDEESVRLAGEVLPPVGV